jgi:hypothetical protein
MTRKYLVGLLLGSLLFVGGGCLGKQSAPAPAAMPSQPPSAQVPASGEDQPLPTDVDSAVDDIVAGVEAEAATDDTESDTSVLTEDRAEIDEIMNSAYDPQ